MDSSLYLLDTIIDSFFLEGELGSDMSVDDLGIGWLDSSHWCGDIDDIGDEF